MQHEPEHKMHVGITNLLLSFLQQLRLEGFNIGIQETLDCVALADLGLIENKLRFKYALRALCCQQPEDLALFNEIFESFWNEEQFHQVPSSRKMIVSPGVIKQTRASLVLLGKGLGGADQQGAHETSGANEKERLMKTDFARLSEMESEWLDQLAARLFREMSQRIRRRFHTRSKGKQVHLRKTLRLSIEKGGLPLRLVYRGKRKQKDKLVLLLDVSGSMDKYSFFLLRFILSLKDHFRDLEVFVFSTRLLRITRLLKRRGMHHTLQQLALEAPEWSGGTRIGFCLQTFNHVYAKLISRSNSVVIMVSDGLDTGDPGLLAAELKKLRKRSKKLIWLNPLKGMRGYAPTARGMQTALPYLDIFESAHNLESILKLEDFLTHA